MIVTRLRLEQVRKFRESLELADLQPGLNVFVGPNEAGKSTIVGAMRAAFFERYRSSAAGTKWLRPWDEPDAAPSIEVDFTIGRTAYKLRKTFLKRSRCELQVDGVTKDGDAAEDELAELLGYTFSLKGESKAEHQGIPGLLWIDQGRAQAIEEPVGNAGDYLRQALDSSASAVATSHSDAIIGALKGRRDELLTETGRHRGALATADAEVESLMEKLAEFDSRIEQYREEIDRLGKLAADEDQERREDARAGLKDALSQAEDTLAVLERQEAGLEKQKQGLELLDRKLQLIDASLKTLSDQDANLETRRGAAAAASQVLDDARDTHVEAKKQQRAAQESFDRSNQSVNLSRQEASRFSLTKTRDDADAEVKALGALISKAQQQAAKIEKLQVLRPKREISSTDVENLRKLFNAQVLAQAKQDALATRLRFSLNSSACVAIGGLPVSDNEERLITSSVSVDIAGVGRIDVTPGAADLNELRSRAAAAAERFRAAAAGLGVETVADGETKRVEAEQLRNDEELAKAELKGLAPWGTEALTQKLSEATRTRDGAALALSELPLVPATPVVPFEAAQQDLVAAESRLRASSTRLQNAATAEASAFAKHEAAVKESDAAAEAVSEPERVRKRAEAAAQRLSIAAQREEADDFLKATRLSLDLARPGICRQDVERRKASLTSFDQATLRRQHEITQLRAKLEGVAVQGLEEERAMTAARLENQRRRRDDLARNSKALDLLVRLLQEKQSVQKRRLQAPLREKVQHYLPLLIPGSELRFNDDLSPSVLVREGRPDAASGSFEDLSFGAREQIGLITRLAYADLLKQADRPTLIILDDALVHSDWNRLRAMHRVLFDASQRHQILLFSCHPEFWREIGAAVRELGSVGVTA